jgi:sugar phosphate isomerase/epimerase
MRIGCCCDIHDASIAHAAGYDFIECKVTSLLPEEPDDAVAAIIDQHRASPVPVAAFNVFLPRDLKIVGPNVDNERIGNYVDSALRRVHQVGATIVVFGSGAARAIPDGFPPREAREQTVRFLHRVADAAERYDIVVVIEPLNSKESNTILSVAEAVDLAGEVNRPSIKVLADFYHMDEELEPLTHLTQYSDWLKHIHVADSGRGAPGTGHYPYEEFAERLRRAGYDGMVSIECRWNHFATEARPALEFLRRTL